MSAAMLDLGFLVLMGAASVGIGLFVLRRLVALPTHPVDAFALAAPLGLGLLALGVLGLGQVGWLTPFALWSSLGVGLAAWLRSGPRLAGRLPSVGGPCPPYQARWFERAFDAALAAVLIGTLLTSLGPVTDGDALCYHLQVPKLFLDFGSVGFEPDLHETVYPMGVELLYAIGLACRGPVACRLVQWLFGLIFAANVTALARPALGPRARWAGTIALLVPAVSNGMGAPLNDVGLAAACTASLHAWVLWWDVRSTGAAALVGLLSGVAIGIKYPALVWCGLLGLGMAAGGRPAARRSMAVFAIATLLVGSCWYARAYRYTGNPVYPFFRHTFGGAGIDDVLDPIKRPMDVTPWNLATALGPMTLEPDRFDSFAHQFGPAFLLFLPGLFLLRLPRRVAFLVGFGMAFLTICLTQRQSMRFVLAAVGPWSVGVAWVAGRLVDRPGVAGRLTLAALLGVMGFESAQALGRVRHGLPVLTGRESASDFLARREPTSVVGRWMGGNLPADARVIGQDHRGFYLPRPYTMELAHRRRTGLGSRDESAGALVAILCDRGFTHLMLCPPVPETAVEFDPTLSRRLAPWLRDREPLYRADLTDGDGVVRRYAIYDLGDRGPKLAETAGGATR